MIKQIQTFIEKGFDWALARSYADFLGPKVVGKSVNETLAQNIDTVFACARAISEPIATMPVHVVRKRKGQKEYIEDHPLNYILNKAPNSYQTGPTFREREMYHMVLWGESFTKIEGSGEERSLHLIHPRRIADYVWDDGLYWRVGETVSNEVVTLDVYNDDDILHVPILAEDIRGVSPIKRAARDLSLNWSVRDFGTGFFANGGKPNNVITTTSANINASAQEKFRKDMKAKYQNGGSIILPYGRDIKNLSFSPEDSQFLDTQKFSVETIARWFGVDPIIIGHMDKGTMNNSAESWRNFSKKTLLPYTTKMAAEYSRKLFTQQEKDEGYEIEFDYSEILKLDPQTRSDYFRTMIQNGVMTNNEVRASEGLNRKEGGDDLLIQQNMAKLKNIEDLNHGRNNNNESFSGQPEDGEEV